MDIIENYKLMCTKYNELAQSYEEKDIHDKRVILRRIFSILDLFGKNQSRVKYSEETFEIFGELRDIQVQILKLESLDVERDTCEYIEFLKKLELKCQKKFKKFCKENPLLFPMIEEKKVEVTNIIKKVKKRLGKVIEKAELLKNVDARSIHKIRIEFKKFRYTLEILYFVEKNDETKLERLKEYQNLLGDIQDLEVLTKGIRRFYGEKSSKKNKTIKILGENKVLKIEKFIEEKDEFIETCQKLVKRAEVVVIKEIKKSDKLFVRIDYKNDGIEASSEDFQDHVEYLKGIASERYFVGGGFANAQGGMIVFKAKALDEANLIAKNDPIIEREMYRFELYEWDLLILSD